MGSFSLAHWLVVIVILLLIFGPKRLSEVGKGLGQGIRNFKKGLDENDKDADEVADEDEEPPAKQLKGGSSKKASAKAASKSAD